MLKALPGFDEVKEAIFSINDDSTSGHDGLSAHFYQACWDIVSSDIYNVIVSIFKGDEISKEMLQNFVFMIHKKKVLDRLKDFRLITLCNVIYKVFSKIITMGFTTFLCEIISPKKGAFVKGRLIIEYMSLTQELMQKLIGRPLVKMLI